MSAITPTPDLALAVVPGEATLDEGRPNILFETETSFSEVSANDTVPEANDNGDGESKGGGAASSASSADAGAARGGAATRSAVSTNTNQVTVEVRAQRERSGSTTPRRLIAAGQSHAPGHAHDEDVTLNSILAKGTTADPEALDDAKSFLKLVPGLRHRRNGSRKELGKLASSDHHADAINAENWRRHSSSPAASGAARLEAREVKKAAVPSKNKGSVAAGSRNVGGTKPTMRSLYDSIGTITDDRAHPPHCTPFPHTIRGRVGPEFGTDHPPHTPLRTCTSPSRRLAATLVCAAQRFAASFAASASVHL